MKPAGENSPIKPSNAPAGMAVPKPPRCQRTKGRSRRDRDARRRAKQAALKAMLDAKYPAPAGVDPGSVMLGRRTSRFLADEKRQWRSCPVRACRRHRFCVAPHAACRNDKPLPPDPTGRRLKRGRVQLQDALRAEVARREAMGGKGGVA